MDPFDEVPLRELVPAVIGVLVRRGAGFAAAEDAVQAALVEALRTWLARVSVAVGSLRSISTSSFAPWALAFPAASI